MKEFIFIRKEETAERSFVHIFKDIEDKTLAALGNETEVSKDEYAEIGARVLFEEFGGNRFELAAEYIVAESVVIGIAARALKEGFMGQIMEGSLRMNIRLRISDLENTEDE